MSENPMRSASEEAAEEFVCKGQAYAATRRRLANLIESKFAPVVAATEEAMKEKCTQLCEWEHCHAANSALAVMRAIRAIPTGTALAEYVERAREEATLAEHKSHLEFENELYGTLVDPVADGTIKEAEMRKQLLESARWYRQHVYDLEGQLNTAVAELRTELRSAADQMMGQRQEIATLKAQLAEAEPIIQTYARENPKRWNPKAEKGMTQSVPQDPMGAHAWLEKHAALSAPAKEGEK